MFPSFNDHSHRQGVQLAITQEVGFDRLPRFGGKFFVLQSTISHGGITTRSDAEVCGAQFANGRVAEVFGDLQSKQP